MHHHIVLFSILGALGYVVIGTGVYFGSALHPKLQDDTNLPFSVGFISVIWPLSFAGWALIMIIDIGVWAYNRLKEYPYNLRQRIVEYRLQREIDREEEEADRQAQREREKRRREEHARRYL